VIRSAGEAVQIALNVYISSAATDNSPSSGIVGNAGEHVHERQNAPSSEISMHESFNIRRLFSRPL
jgi:hypothetical protein